MTNEEILKKAIEKAVKQGFRWLEYFGKNGFIQIKGTIEEVTSDLMAGKMWRIVIFDHAFAKAFWGEPPMNVCGLRSPDETRVERPHAHKGYCIYLSWAWNLQQMVLEEDPISYLKQFL